MSGSEVARREEDEEVVEAEIYEPPRAEGADPGEEPWQEHLLGIPGMTLQRWYDPYRMAESFEAVLQPMRSRRTLDHRGRRVTVIEPLGPPIVSKRIVSGEVLHWAADPRHYLEQTAQDMILGIFEDMIRRLFRH